MKIRYTINMPKEAVSVTLDSENLTWLKGRVGATGARSVSELLDGLVTAARTRGDVGPSKSVVGTIDIDSSDPLLEKADSAVRAIFETSLGRPLMVKEKRASHGEQRRPERKHRG